MSMAIIVTNPEFGWDCIVEIYDSAKVSYKEVSKRYKEKDGYIIFERPLATEVEQE